MRRFHPIFFRSEICRRSEILLRLKTFIRFARKPSVQSLLFAAMASLLATGCKTYDQQNQVVRYWRQGNLPKAVAEADKMA
jgi:hypothetical protein